MSTSAIAKHPEILGGTLVFTGTRVPVRILLEHFEAGETLDEFLEGFPSVTRQQAVDFLDLVISQLPKLDDEAVA